MNGGQEGARARNISTKKAQLWAPTRDCPFLNCPALQTFRGEKVEKRRAVSLPQRRPLLGAAGVAWSISTARHPGPSICLPPQTVSAALMPSCLASFLMGVPGHRPFLPFPPHWGWL